MICDKNGFTQLAGLPAAEFILHRDPVLLLDFLEEAGPQHAVCTWQVPESGLFHEGELGVPSYVGLECMAQCVAAHAGARARIDGRGPPLGLLLGTRQFRSTDSHLAAERKDHIACRERIRDEQGLASYDCTMTQAGYLVAECRITVLERIRGADSVESRD